MLLLEQVVVLAMVPDELDRRIEFGGWKEARYSVSVSYL